MHCQEREVKVTLGIPRGIRENGGREIYLAPTSQQPYEADVERIVDARLQQRSVQAIGETPRFAAGEASVLVEQWVRSWIFNATDSDGITNRTITSCAIGEPLTETYVGSGVWEVESVIPNSGDTVRWRVYEESRTVGRVRSDDSPIDLALLPC